MFSLCCDIVYQFLRGTFWESFVSITRWCLAINFDLVLGNQHLLEKLILVEFASEHTLSAITSNLIGSCFLTTILHLESMQLLYVNFLCKVLQYLNLFCTAWDICQIYTRFYERSLTTTPERFICHFHTWFVFAWVLFMYIIDFTIFLCIRALFRTNFISHTYAYDLYNYLARWTISLSAIMVYMVMF